MDENEHLTGRMRVDHGADDKMLRSYEPFTNKMSRRRTSSFDSATDLKQNHVGDKMPRRWSNDDGAGADAIGADRSTRSKSIDHVTATTTSRRRTDTYDHHLLNRLWRRKSSGDELGVSRHAPETFHVRCTMEDSIHVQKKRNKVMDDEKHEENPHLQDFLHPHHFVQITAEESESDDEHDVDMEQAPPRPTAPLRSCLKSDAPDEPVSDPNHPPRKKVVKMVTWHDVTVRDYSMTLGDHPNCSYGPPVTLAWDYLEYDPLSVDEYEIHHPPRRTLRQLMMNYYKRKNLLMFYGEYSEGELKAAWKEVKKIQKQRAITKMFLPARMAEEAIESVGRRMKKKGVKSKTPKDGMPIE